MNLHYPSGRYSEAAIQRFAHHLKHVLKSGVLDIDKPIKELSICPPNEEHVILHNFNQQVSNMAQERT
ncbi:hypothetical protein, partial [Shouchella clausii]